MELGLFQSNWWEIKKYRLYNNVKSDAYTPINTADDYKTFGEYIDMISKGPAAWRIFLFNIFDHAPQLINDFTWPEAFNERLCKKIPDVIYRWCHQHYAYAF